MMHRPIIIFAIVAMAACAAPAAAGTAPPTHESLAARFEQAPDSPLVETIRAIVADSREREAVILADEDLSPEARQESLDRLRRHTQLRVLRAQARHARAAGSLALAESIEARIAELAVPPAPTPPGAPAGD